ncbi:hypothetical protein [Arthrobacter sp. efr-133-TYG-104]|uniref:hypothetical protein n=1 Tax=Arthrobacter sp. efr-133-TYG-104 TaxID=3040324 RepID=UPI00254E42D7|nr:hypothetical protein [Arthrobacter sp. efr-133-TYG-104]
MNFPSESLRPVTVPASNYDVWPGSHFEWDTVAHFLEGPQWRDGVHTIGLGSGPDLDIFVSGNPLEESNAVIPVFFNGAITGREDKSGPFFSGRKISAMGGFGFIAVSDPSVNLDPTLGLAWYAGNAHQSLQDSLTSLLREISARSGRELLLIGGSGGGFASLYFGHELGEAASVLVWNPQTRIIEYNPIFVKNYITKALAADADLEDSDWKRVAEHEARRFGVGLDALDCKPRRLLYMQNGTDWHTPVHAVPFLQHGDFQHRGKGLYNTDENHVVWIASYGVGHAPLPEKALLAAIQLMRDPDLSALQTTQQLKTSLAGEAAIISPGWPKVSDILPLSTELYDLTCSDPDLGTSVPPS